MEQREVAPKNKEWVSIAGLELQEIKVRWNLPSYRKLASALFIDARTLGKLNSEHLDYSFSLDALDNLYHHLLFLVPIFFTGKEQEEETRFIVESRFRILKHEGSIPPKMFALYEEEVYQASRPKREKNVSK